MWSRSNPPSIIIRLTELEISRSQGFVTPPTAETPDIRLIAKSPFCFSSQEDKKENVVTALIKQ